MADTKEKLFHISYTFLKLQILFSGKKFEYIFIFVRLLLLLFQRIGPPIRTVTNTIYTWRINEKRYAALPYPVRSPSHKSNKNMGQGWRRCCSRKKAERCDKIARLPLHIHTYTALC